MQNINNQTTDFVNDKSLTHPSGVGRLYNWALLGCGSIAKSFASDLQRLSNANLYAVASRDKEKANQYAIEFGFEIAYASYKEMLTDPKVDIVYISTPHTFHYEHTLMALKHKKAVLCEKPFAMNSVQLAEMIACAKENNCFLMEAFWTRFLPHFTTTLNILNSRELGELKMICANFAFTAEFVPDGRFFNPDLGGGSLLDIGIYTVFFAFITLGKPIEIQTMQHIGSTGVEESILMSFKYADGKMASLMSSITTHATSHTEYCCENGYVRINKGAYSPTTVSVWKNGDAQERIVELPTFEEIGYLYEAEHVMECLDAGKKQSDILPWAFSTDFIEILDRVRRCANIVFTKSDSK